MMQVREETVVQSKGTCWLMATIQAAADRWQSHWK